MKKIGLEANFSFNEVCPPYIKEFENFIFFQFRGPFYTSMLNFLNLSFLYYIYEDYDFYTASSPEFP